MKDKSLAVWDTCSGGFVVKPGEYTVHAGKSSENTLLTATATVG